MAGTCDVASLPDPELVWIRGRKRDNSFLTPQWKYHRSVHARMLSATRRGASWSEVFREVPMRSEEHTSELQSLMRISYAVFCSKKKITTRNIRQNLISTCSSSARVTNGSAQG